ncbi:MAG TPA: hypothetical protein DDY78_29225 [Planctomycetales bacterium]|nr:hypothetical protein [Planctomycetales bacterium]
MGSILIRWEVKGKATAGRRFRGGGIQCARPRKHNRLKLKGIWMSAGISAAAIRIWWYEVGV